MGIWGGLEMDRHEGSLPCHKFHKSVKSESETNIWLTHAHPHSQFPHVHVLSDLWREKPFI